MWYLNLDLYNRHSNRRNDMNIKKILVIDDSPQNVASAHLTLQDFDYTVVDNIADAYEILQEGEIKFDVVLTDLWLPRGNFTGAMRGTDSPDELIPAGLVFAIRAANSGMTVVICTDSDHHQDRLCSVMDLINDWENESRLVHYVEARICPVEGVWRDGEIVLCEDWLDLDGPYPKDWKKAMQNAEILPWDWESTEE